MVHTDGLIEQKVGDLLSGWLLLFEEGFDGGGNLEGLLGLLTCVVNAIRKGNHDQAGLDGEFHDRGGDVRPQADLFALGRQAVDFAFADDKNRDGAIPGDQDSVGLHVRADHDHIRLDMTVMFRENPAGDGPDGRTIPDALADVADHAVTDHRGDALIALIVDPAVRHHSRKPAIGAFDDFNRVAAFRQKSIVNFRNSKP